MGTGSCLGVKRGWGVMLTPHPLLVLWSWKGSAVALLPLWALRPVQSLTACTRVNFTYFTDVVGDKFVRLKPKSSVHSLIVPLWYVSIQNFKFQWFIIIAIRPKSKYRSLADAISLSFILDKDCSNNNSICPEDVTLHHFATSCQTSLSFHCVVIITLRTGLLNCLNARSWGLTFRHRVSCI